MSVQDKTEKINHITISRLIEIAIQLDEEQQKELLRHAESLLVIEKRTNIRKACNIQINYASNDRVYTNQITNISANGLFIETNKSLVRGDELIMTFRLDGFDKSLKLKGEVARTVQTGVGVELKNISPHVEDMIRFIVKNMKQ